MNIVISDKNKLCLTFEHLEKIVLELSKLSGKEKEKCISTNSMYPFDRVNKMNILGILLLKADVFFPDEDLIHIKEIKPINLEGVDNLNFLTILKLFVTYSTFDVEFYVFGKESITRMFGVCPQKGNVIVISKEVPFNELVSSEVFETVFE